MSRLRNLKGSPFWREKQSDLSDRWSTNNLVTKYRLKQYINQCGHFHSETPNFFTVLKHSENKKNSLAEEMKEKEWISKEKAPLGFLYDFSDDKVIRPFFFLAESVLLFLVGEALQQRNLFSNCKNHFRKRST